MAVNVTKCPGCNRLVAPKSGACTYCGKALAGGAPQPEEHRGLAGGKARFDKKIDDRGHYLLSESREPVQLDAGKLFVLGRDPRTSMQIHAGDVSRQHAEIDWQGEPSRPVLCEVRSKNGTYLNDRLVTRDAPQPLRHGDRIRLGGEFTLIYLNADERGLKKELQERSQEATREMKLPAAAAPAAPAEPPPPDIREREVAVAPARPTGAMAAPRRPQPPTSSMAARKVPTSDELDGLVNAALGDQGGGGIPLEGSFAATSGSDLVRQLVDGKVTGVLTVFDGTQTGEVHIREGQCATASFGRTTGRGALQMVVRLRQGSFRFRPGEPGGAPSGDLEGSLGSLPGRDLIRTLLQQKRTGTLTVFDGQETGQVTLVDGVCEQAVFGGATGREALNAIVGLDQGAYRFHAEAGGSGRPASDLMEGDASWGDQMAAPAAPAPRRPAPPPPAAELEPAPAPPAQDPWEVDPDDTLMPQEFPPGSSPLRSAQPATGAPPLKEGGRDDRSRVPPLRTPRAPEPASRTPLRPGPGAPPAAPPGGGGTAPSRSTSQRRAPPPLPPRDPSSSTSDRLRRPT